tara:strand:- start:50 stop:757 length:708 start_codon:yes stop_codon:yes gene_type:complete
MNFKNFIFCAIDFSDLEQSKRLISKIQRYIGGIKIGLEFFSKNGPSGFLEIQKLGIPIFLDLKLKDIPNTVKKSAQNLIDLKPDYLSIHLTGGLTMVKEVISIKKNTKILGVSMLTSLDEDDLKSFGYNLSNLDYVGNLAKIGEKAGVDGLVSSANEIPHLKSHLNNTKMLFVTPGIRLSKNKMNDQKRINSPSQAIKNGSKMLIVGRSITQSGDPINSIKCILQDIEKHYEHKN